jgi:formyltetrahydrofolate synthetase
MERDERELIQKVLKTNFEVRKLYNQHVEYEDKLAKLARQVYLTASEEVEERRMKMAKLRGVERMLKLVSAGDDLAA